MKAILEATGDEIKEDEEGEEEGKDEGKKQATEVNHEQVNIKVSMVLNQVRAILFPFYTPTPYRYRFRSPFTLLAPPLTRQPFHI